MTRLLRQYQEWILLVTALVFGGLIVLFFIWGTGLLIASFDEAFSSREGEAEKSDFRSIEAKEILQRRGLL